MYDSSEQLEGLELRKAVLEAAGLHVASFAIAGHKQFCLVDAQDEKVAYQGDYYQFSEPDMCWKVAPAVESSVDAALKWLVLDEDHFWEHKQGINWMAVIMYANERAVVSAIAPTLAVAMCRAYLQYKGGA